MLFILMASLLAIVHSSVCPRTVTPVCQNLDIARYSGIWYEQVNSKSFTYDDSLTCVTANYSFNDDGTIQVFNSGSVNSPSGNLSTAIGTATITDLQNCKLGVKFSRFQPVNAPYDVFDTDYESYAVVVSCGFFSHIFSKEDIWILSRVPTMPVSLRDSIFQKLKAAGFDYSDYRDQVQGENCNYNQVQTNQMTTDLIILSTFDGAKGTTQTWTQKNDPVMGGKSVGTFAVDNDRNVGVFNGTCAIVPFLQAPGFIKVESSGALRDVSACENLVLNVRSLVNYTGYRVSFGNVWYPGGKFFARGYKSNFQAPVGVFEDVVLPFHQFSSHWDDATGDQITTCAQDPKACPTKNDLLDLKTISIWAEGIAGSVTLEINRIAASGCASVAISV